MASYEDQLKLVMQVQGEQEIRALEGKVSDLKQTIRDLSAELAAGTIKQDEFAQHATAAADQILQAQARMGQLQAGTRNVGMAALEASRAMEDLQYGVAGVVNNIPGLVMSLGGTAGLTATISLLAVGINQLVKHWGEFKEALGLAGTETEAERMERLEHATKRTAEETRQLNEYKKEQAEIQRLLDSQTSEAEGQKRGVGAALAGHADVIAGALVDQRIDEKGEADLITDPAVRAAYLNNLAQGEQIAKSPMAGSREVAARMAREREAMLAPFRDAARKDALGLMAGAETDPAKLRELDAALARMGGGPVPGLRADLFNAMPENARAQRELELQGNARGKQLRDEAARQAKLARGMGEAEDAADDEARKAMAKAARDAQKLARGMGEAEDAADDAMRKLKGKAAAEAAQVEAQANRDAVREAQRDKAGLEGTDLTRSGIREAIQAQTGFNRQQADEATRRAVELFSKGLDINIAMEVGARETYMMLVDVNRKLMELQELQRGNAMLRRNGGR